MRCSLRRCRWVVVVEIVFEPLQLRLLFHGRSSPPSLTGPTLPDSAPLPCCCELLTYEVLIDVCGTLAIGMRVPGAVENTSPSTRPAVATDRVGEMPHIRSPLQNASLLRSGYLAGTPWCDAIGLKQIWGRPRHRMLFRSLSIVRLPLMFLSQSGEA